MLKSAFLNLGLISSIFLIFTPAMADHSNNRVNSKKCPYSCETEGISRKYCKDWKEGKKCFVEDLRAPHRVDSETWHQVDLGHSRPDPYHDSCYGRKYHKTPDMEVFHVEKVSGYSDSFRVKGYISGSCIKDAAIYENKHFIEGIRTRTDSAKRRYYFSAVIHDSYDPRVKVYLANGKVHIFELDPSYHYHHYVNYRKPHYSSHYYYNRYPHNYHYGYYHRPYYGHYYGSHYHGSHYHHGSSGHHYSYRSPRRNITVSKPKLPELPHHRIKRKLFGK